MMEGSAVLDRADPATDDAVPKARARGRKSAAKREAILRAAIEIVNAKSFALATMTEIAASLDLRDATLYYYFPSKQALVYACHLRSLERFERTLRAADEAGGSGADKLRRFIRDLLEEWSANGPQMYFGDYSYLQAAQRETIADWAARLTEMLEQFLKEGMADGSVVQSESALVVQLLLGMLIWLAKWAPAIKDLTVDRLMVAIGAFSLHGLESRPGS